jgi:hypothetical protein
MAAGDFPNLLHERNHAQHRIDRRAAEPHLAGAVNGGLKTTAAQANSVVVAKTMVAGIDLQSGLLTPANVELLQALSNKYEAYLRQGRGREAHAMATAMLIVWRKFSEPDITLELPDTAYGGLE